MDTGFKLYPVHPDNPFHRIPQAAFIIRCCNGDRTRNPYVLPDLLSRYTAGFQGIKRKKQAKKEYVRKN